MDLRKTHEIRWPCDLILGGIFLLGILIFVVGDVLGGWWRVLSGMAMVGEFFWVYGIWIEPFWLRVKTYRVDLVKEPTARLTVAWLSDLHAGSFHPVSWYERIVEVTNALHPDVVVLGGDYVVDRAESVMELEALSHLTAEKKYFVMGNHDLKDYPQEIRRVLVSWGFEDLSHRTVPMQLGERSMELCGVDSIWYGRVTLPVRSSSEIPHVTFSHEPDLLMDLSPGQTDLVVAGHTHGGTIRLPFMGACVPIPAKLKRRVDRGEKIVNGIRAIVGTGLGATDLRMRFGARPEIVLLDLGI